MQPKVMINKLNPVESMDIDVADVKIEEVPLVVPPKLLNHVVTPEPVILEEVNNISLNHTLKKATPTKKLAKDSPRKVLLTKG